MEISASQVKELREKTGAGMMDCKKALTETAGDFEKAVEFLRKKGMASAAKKAGRATKEGLVSSYIHGEGNVGVLLEVNCETDFVARTEQFRNFVKDLCTHIAQAKPKTVEELMAQPMSNGKTGQVMLQEAIAALGENMGVRRFERFEAAADGKGTIASYIHGEGKVGVLLDLAVGSATAAHSDAVKAFAKDLTMHIAAAAPQYVMANEVPGDVTAKEKEIALAQIQNSGKAMKPEFMDKAVEGRVRKLLEEICLLTQPFVKDPTKTIEKLLQETSKTLGQEVSVRRFARFVLGEGMKEATEEAAH
ncbi:MAG: translation elongation factor Ts [Bdellovibrionia bacterium]